MNHKRITLWMHFELNSDTGFRMDWRLKDALSKRFRLWFRLIENTWKDFWPLFEHFRLDEWNGNKIAEIFLMFYDYNAFAWLWFCIRNENMTSMATNLQRKIVDLFNEIHSGRKSCNLQRISSKSSDAHMLNVNTNVQQMRRYLILLKMKFSQSS